MSEWIECFAQRPVVPDDAIDIEIKWNDGSSWSICSPKVIADVPDGTWAMGHIVACRYRLAVARQEPVYSARITTMKDGEEVIIRELDWIGVVREGKQVTTGLAQGCHRSHPHENMDAACERKTEIAGQVNAAQEAPFRTPVSSPGPAARPDSTNSVGLFGAATPDESTPAIQPPAAAPLRRDRFGLRYPELREVTRHAELPMSLSAFRKYT